MGTCREPAPLTTAVPPARGASETGDRCRYQIETLAVLKLSSPCFGIASICPRPLPPNKKDRTGGQERGSPGKGKSPPKWQAHSGSGDSGPLLPPMPLTVMAVGGKVLLVEVVADPESLELSEEAVEAAAAVELHAQTSAPEAIMRQVFAQLLERPLGRGAAARGDDAAPNERPGGDASSAQRRQTTAEDAGAHEEAGGEDGPADGGGAGSGQVSEDTQWTQRVMVRAGRLCGWTPAAVGSSRGTAAATADCCLGLRRGVGAAPAESAHNSVVCLMSGVLPQSMRRGVFCAEAATRRVLCQLCVLCRGRPCRTGDALAKEAGSVGRFRRVLRAHMCLKHCRSLVQPAHRTTRLRIGAGLQGLLRIVRPRAGCLKKGSPGARHTAHACGPCMLPAWLRRRS